LQSIRSVLPIDVLPPDLVKMGCQNCLAFRLLNAHGDIIDGFGSAAVG
jgi:hypothetical protein